MNTRSWVNMVEGINILLVLALIIRWSWGGWTPSSPPTLYTLFDSTDGMDDLHAPDAVSNRIVKTFQQNGGIITVEDIIRHLHDHPELLSTPTHTALFEQMLLTQTTLLNTEEELQIVELKMNKLALKIYNSLAETDKVRIRSRRNTDSVEGIEAQYWNSVLKQIQDTENTEEPEHRTP